MKVNAEDSGILGEPIHELVGHEGILGVMADPALLSEDKLREMAAEDSAGLTMTLRKLSYRHESVACEVGALKLEKTAERIHGVRRATATYFGEVSIPRRHRRRMSSLRSKEPGPRSRRGR
jgi:hypothetical protein